MGLGSGIAKLTAIFLLVFLVLGNIMAPPEVKLMSPSGPERFIVVPVKFVEYRMGKQDYVETSPYSSLDLKFGKPLDKAPFWEFNAEELLYDVRSDYVKNYVDRIIKETSKRIKQADHAPTPDLLRGTAFMVMWSEGRIYENIGGTHLPSHTISTGGDCDDWTMVRWAIIRTINERYGIRALYFMVEVEGNVAPHAFLAVYYPDSGSWELYDWFAIRKIFVVLSGFCPYCVVRPVAFPDLKTALTAYYLGARATGIWGDILAKYGRVRVYLLPTERSPKIYPVEFDPLLGIDYFSPTKNDIERAERVVSLAWKGVVLRENNESGNLTYRVVVFSEPHLRVIYDGSASLKNGGLLISLNVSGLVSPVEITANGGHFSFLNPDEIDLMEWERPAMIGDWLAFGRVKVALKSKKLTLLVSPGEDITVSIKAVDGNGLLVRIVRL